MIFVDSWAWIALLDDTDQYHREAQKAHRKLLKKYHKYVTSDFVLNELINYLYCVGPAKKAKATINALLLRGRRRHASADPRFPSPVSRRLGIASAL
jgi:predicted nucleic acid-binding protein